MKSATAGSTVSLTAELGETSSDPIDARAAAIRGRGDVARVLSELGEGVYQFRSILVEAGDIELGEGDVASLARAATCGIRVVMVAPRPVGGFPPLLVLHEADFRRALIASLYSLQRGEKLLALTRLAPDSGRLRGMVRHAMLWRASWREPEEGDFSAVPV